jgi:hypothetical protein
MRGALKLTQMPLEDRNYFATRLAAATLTNLASSGSASIALSIFYQVSITAGTVVTTGSADRNKEARNSVLNICIKKSCSSRNLSIPAK